MAEAAFAYLIPDKLAGIVARLAELHVKALALGDRAVSDGFVRVLDGLTRDVEQMSIEMAALADAEIVAHIYTSKTSRRPETNTMPTHIRSEPGPLGLVRVALLSELDKIVNPEGWGTYWRAQEFGTGVGRVPTQIGRRLPPGTFEPSGEPPREALRGVNVGTDLAFFPGGRNPGSGRIFNDLPGRHFLRDGTAEAAALFVKRCREIGDKWGAEVEALTTAILAAV